MLALFFVFSIWLKQRLLIDMVNIKLNIDNDYQYYYNL